MAPADNDNNCYAMVIVGSGPAGLTAGIYGARAHLHPLIIEGTPPGGQLMSTTFVENWPGIPRIRGPELMNSMREQARQLGCTFMPGVVTKVDTAQRPFVVTTSDNQTVHAQTIIIATGATPKLLRVPGEQRYWTKGVTVCAVCDGAFYPNKRVLIVGGGDTAMEDAAFMAGLTDQITIVQNMPHLTASATMQERVLAHKNIKILYETTVQEIKGNEEHVTHIELKNTKNNAISTLPVDAIFIAIGSTPNSRVFAPHVTCNPHGHIKVSNGTHTSVPGIFAAGDVADGVYRQAITSAGTGCMAALDAQRYLQSLSLQ